MQCVCDLRGTTPKLCLAHAAEAKRIAKKAVELCAKVADGYGDSLGSREEYDIVSAETGRRVAQDIRDAMEIIAASASQ